MRVGLLLAFVLLSGCSTPVTQNTTVVERYCFSGHSQHGSSSADVVPPGDGLPGFAAVSWESDTEPGTNALMVELSWSAAVGVVYARLTTPEGQERFDQSPIRFERENITQGDYLLELRSDDGAAQLDYTFLFSVSTRTPNGVAGCDVDSFGNQTTRS